jgi:hypothetical protein
MMRITAFALSTLVLSLALVPAPSLAQVNTTGTLSPNTSTVQVQSPTTTFGTPPATTTTPPPTTTTTTPGATTNGTTATPTNGATAVARDAAIVVCGADFSTGSTRLLVSSASTSAGGPTIPPGAPCAQALSDLFAAGFGVIDVLPVNQQVQYTLVR